MLLFCVKMCGFEKNRIFFHFFLVKNLHISKKSCNFAPSFEKEMTRTPKRKPIKTNKIMTLTSYTKYVLNQGETIRVYLVSLDRPTPSQLCAQLNCDAKYDETKGQWYVVMTKDNWQAKCKALRGRQMNFFTMEH